MVQLRRAHALTGFCWRSKAKSENLILSRRTLHLTYLQYMEGKHARMTPTTAFALMLMNAFPESTDCCPFVTVHQQPRLLFASLMSSFLSYRTPAALIATCINNREAELTRPEQFCSCDRLQHARDLKEQDANTWCVSNRSASGASRRPWRLCLVVS